MSKSLPPGVRELPPGVFYTHVPACVRRPHRFKAKSPHTGRTKSKNFATVKEGVRWATGQRTGMETRTTADGKVLWATAAEDYLVMLKERGRRDRYIASVRQIADAVTAAGALDITAPGFREVVRRFLDGLSTAQGSRRPGEPASAGTKLRYLAVIRAVVHQAAADRFVPFDPVAGIKGPRQRRTIMQTLTLEEARACVAPAMESDQYFLRFALMLYLGLRERSEGLWLRWEDYDQARGIMQVREREGVNELKTGEREVPVPDELTAILARTPRKGPFILAEHLRLDRDGKPLEDRTDYSRFKAYLRRAMTPANPSEKQVAEVEARVEAITRHSIRHLYARIMAATGVSLSTLKTRMGHSAISTTMIYSEGSDSYEPLVDGWPKGQWRLRPAAGEVAVAQ